MYSFLSAVKLHGRLRLRYSYFWRNCQAGIVHNLYVFSDKQFLLVNDFCYIFQWFLWYWIKQKGKRLRDKYILNLLSNTTETALLSVTKCSRTGNHQWIPKIQRKKMRLSIMLSANAQPTTLLKLDFPKDLFCWISWTFWNSSELLVPYNNILKNDIS